MSEEKLYAHVWPEFKKFKIPDLIFRYSNDSKWIDVSNDWLLDQRKQMIALKFENPTII